MTFYVIDSLRKSGNKEIIAALVETQLKILYIISKRAQNQPKNKHNLFLILINIAVIKQNSLQVI